MRPASRLSRSIACCALSLVLAAAASPHAQANWLWKIVHGTGDAGQRSARHGLGALDAAAAHVKALPAGPKTALAVHATPEGHWKFVNRDGEVFTAGTPGELKRAVPTLAPDTARSEAGLAFYLSEDTVFAGRTLLKQLPEGANLHVVINDVSYPVASRPGATAERLFAEFRPNVAVEIRERVLFDEAVRQLSRPLNKADIRILALTPGGPKRLRGAPRTDPASEGALVDAIDPDRLAGALSAVRAQTVLVTGRVEGNALRFRPASGPERSIPLPGLIAAAEAADVNLIILHASAPRQPGGRNWLWQRIEVDGLDQALRRATFADFLDALGARRGQLVVTATPAGPGRIVVRAMPSGPDSAPVTGAIGGWLGDITSGITGNVIARAVDVHARSAERQRELDSRIIPGIPSGVQIAYLAGLIMGFVGLSFAGAWWARIWPPERREDYGSATGFRAAQGIRLAVFVLLFLPLAGAPAFIAALAVSTWATIAAPYHWLRRRLANDTPQPG